MFVDDVLDGGEVSVEHRGEGSPSAVGFWLIS